MSPALRWTARVTSAVCALWALAASAAYAESDDATETPASTAPKEPSASPARAIRVEAGTGLGAGTLSFVRPTATGEQSLENAPFVASELALHVRIQPEAEWSFDLLVAYQTSVGFSVQLEPLFALPERLPVRAQRTELSLAPTLRLGSRPRAPELALPIGAAFRTFSPNVHQYAIADYTLASALLRAELQIHLGEWVDLQAGPEVEWLAVIDASWNHESTCCSGVGFGGQGVFRARVGETLRFAVAYRESHAFAPASSWRFKQIERFLTVRIAGEL